MKKGSILILLIFFSAWLQAESQSLDLIREKVEDFIFEKTSSREGESLRVNVDKMDSRLKLRACQDNNLEVFNPYKVAITQTNTLGVRCSEAENHWTVYVPIKVSIFKSILASNRDLAKGSILREADLSFAEMDVQGLKSSYITDATPLIGLIAKTTIPAGTAIDPSQFQLPKLIRKGEQISIVGGNEFFTVKMIGLALEDGVLGDSISVKNLSSKKIIQAQVSGEQQVRIFN